MDKTYIVTPTTTAGPEILVKYYLVATLANDSATFLQAIIGGNCCICLENIPLGSVIRYFVVDE